MTTYASFKLSVQFLEAGEKAQQFANAANTFKPLLSQEARQSIEGIDKVSQAFTATGRALEHFGFDEAEDEIIGDNSFKEKVEGANQMVMPFAPKDVKGPIGTLNKINQAIDYVNYDPNNPDPTLNKIKEAAANNDQKELNRYKISSISTASQLAHERAVRIANDPNASTGEKIKAVVSDIAIQTNPVIQMGKSIENAFAGIGKLTGWWDEMEPDVSEGSAYQGEFSSNPETLAPIDFNSSVVADAYQQQEGSGADLIGGQTNQRSDSDQAQENQYAVLT